MSNYHMTRCAALVNNPSVSSELRMIAEALVAIAGGVDDADSMAQQALERIDSLTENLRAMERRLDALELRTPSNS
jgi:hypothetical protein